MAKKKRYNLVLPEELFDQLKAISDETGSSVLEVIKNLIKAGLVVYKVHKDPDGELIIRRRDTEREVQFII